MKAFTRVRSLEGSHRRRDARSCAALFLPFHGFGTLAATWLSLDVHQPRERRLPIGFGWTPLLELRSRHSVMVFALLFVWTGLGTMVAAHWAQRYRDQRQTRRWPLAMVGLVLTMELLQLQVPGRGPDVATLGALGLALLGSGVLARIDR